MRLCSTRRCEVLCPSSCALLPGTGRASGGFADDSLLMLAIGAVLLGWLLALEQAQRSSLSIWIGTGVAYGCVGLLSWRQARSLPCGWLVWTGHVWRLSPQTAPQQRDDQALNLPDYGSCFLVLDLQRVMLLQLQYVQEGLARKICRPCWVWVSRGTDHKHWHALRCAVVWSQTVQAEGRQSPARKGVLS